MITNRWNLTVCCSKSSGRRWASVVLVRRLTEWRRFHFWHQPRDALNSESSLNSFAFRRTINPLTAIPICKTKWEGYQTIEFVLTFVKTGQWESFIHNVVTWYYDSFESHTFNSSADWVILWSCFCCFKIQNQCPTKNLPRLLCSVNHSSILWSGSGYFGVKHPIVFRFADNLISLLKRFAWSFLQRRTMDSLVPYSLAISELFSTASASATILSLSARLYDVRRALGRAWWQLDLK